MRVERQASGRKGAGARDLPDLNYKDLAAALLPMADTLVPLWLSGGTRRGHEWVCGSLAGGKGSSFSVNLVTGEWADFADGDRIKGGDLLSLYAAIHDLSMGKACVELARAHGLEAVAGVVLAADGSAPPARPPRPAPPPKPVPERESWRAVAPVPAYAPAVNFTHQHRVPEDIVHVCEYRLGDALYGYVVRFRTSDGGKDDIARTWCESQTKGGARWHWKQWQEPRPLYLPGRALPEGRTVILVEGERKGDVLQELLDRHAPGVYCVAGWPGGCKAWAKADWAWLAGATVVLWPDCDSKRVQPSVAERKAAEAEWREEFGMQALDPEALRTDARWLEAWQSLKDGKPLLPYNDQPGMKAQRAIGALLRDTHGCTVSLLPIEQPGVLPDGWDCKDAIEVDGWSGERVLEFLARAVAFADAADAAKPGKPLRPVGTGGSGDGGGGGPPGGAAPAADGGEGEGWDQELVACGSRKVPRWLSWYYDADKERWNVSRKTVIAALEKCPDLRGVVAYDELRNTIARRRAFPWPDSRPGELRDSDALLLGDWMSNEWGLPSVSIAALEEGIKTVANKNRYHPVREWLKAQQWDEKSRVDNWLVYVLGESPQSLQHKPRLLEYLRLVGRFWLLGMVRRVMEPGCKFDYMPVLEGAGGLRKSTLVEVLAGTEYYSDTKFDIGHGHEGQEQVQGIWLYEIAELAGMSKSEVTDIKAFVSSKVDRYRVAYGKIPEAFPRQCVLVGTTNEDTYLRDRTGNRRFWPVPVWQIINTEWVQKYRHQLLAEAYALYLQGERYTPTADEEARLFHPMQESRLVETAVESELLAVLTRKPNLNATGPASFVHAEAVHVTLAQLVQALGVDVAKAPPGLQLQISAWLKHQGWQHLKKMIGGVRVWRYHRPSGWPRNDAPVGLDHPDDDEGAGGVEFPAPAPQSPPAPVAQSPAAAFNAAMEDEDAPF